MNQGQIEGLLQDGITAAKKGNSDKANELLLSVIEADQDNDKAWLWLSGVVKSDKDRRICLENVLILNPDSAAAKRGLDRLGEADFDSDDNIFFTDIEPISPAAAILYPERQVREQRWLDPVDQHFPQCVGYAAHSKFDDIWERDSDICQYCAAELQIDDRRCPKCGRSLIISNYRYPNTSSDLIIYWILLIGVAQLSLVLIMLNLLLRESLVATTWHGLVLVVTVILVVGVFLRQFWAYVTSLVFLLLTLTTLLLGFFMGPLVEDVVAQAVSSGFFQSLSDRPFVYVLGPFEDLLAPLQVIAVVVALFFGIFRVGPDFERVKVRQVAQVERGIGDASQFYAAGQQHAKRKRWASAVLQYQRAVAKDPSRPYYQRALGQAYAKLGFYQRSLDVLESAHRLAHLADLELELEQIIAQVRQEQAASVMGKTGQ